MIRLYEKVCKTEETPFGIKEVIAENPLKNGPCVITVIATPIFLKEVNGAMRQVADLINPDIDNTYDANRRIFGLGFGNFNEEYGRFSMFSPSLKDIDEFINKYFVPLFVENFVRLEPLKAMKNFRNINFLTYCNGAKSVLLIERCLKEKMTEVGYSEGEINMILSQICFAAISGNILKNNDTNTLAISFGDVNDYDFENDEKTINGIEEINKGFIKYDSSIGFAVSKDSNHSFKRHMTEDSDLSKMISCFLNTSIDNAIENKYNEVVEPITYKKMEYAFDEIMNENLKTR